MKAAEVVPKPLTEVFAALSAASLRGAKGDWRGCLAQLEAARDRLTYPSATALDALRDLVKAEITAAARLQRKKAT